MNLFLKAKHHMMSYVKGNKKPTLFVVTGPSGSGKTTIMRSLMSNELLSFTTRPMRTEEIDGKDYEFISQNQFDAMYNSGKLVEYTTYIGNGYSYGLTRKELLSKIIKGDAFFVCDSVGAKMIEDICSEYYSDIKIVKIFFYDDKISLGKNMRHRGDSIDTINGRLKTYDSEAQTMVGYDYVVKNKRLHLDKTLKVVRKIIAVEGSGRNVR